MREGFIVNHVLTVTIMRKDKRMLIALLFPRNENTLASSAYDYFCFGGMLGEVFRVYDLCGL